MTRWTMMLFILTLLCGNNISQAQERQEAEEKEDEELTVEEQMAKIAELGPGVHSIQKDKKGHISACIVVGQARISTVLGKSKGMELARDKANLACSTEFVKWLKEEVQVYTSSDDETIVLMEGAEGEEESLNETGKSVNKQTKKMESISKGLVRGLQVLHKQVDGDGKTFTIVKGWTADTAEGTKKIAADLASDEPDEKKSKSPTTGDADKSSGAKGSKIDKEIESDSATSDDAAEFLPKRKKK